MYKNLRASGTFSYDYVENRFESHQSKWPENLFNEDADFKYIDPLINDGNDSYLDMLQGSKTEQRKWWLYNRFKYLDSKYVAGEAASDVITLRGYAKDDITVTPFNDIYVDIKYGSVLGQERGAANVATTIACPLDNVNDTEIYIYSASQIKEVSDITGLKVGYADFSMATKLQQITIHDDEENPNMNLTRLGLGNNELLKTIICRDAPNLTSSIDLSGCSSLQTANFGNTNISGVQLANGASVKTLILPETISNLTLRNTANLETLSIGDDTDYSHITTLWIENVDMIIKNNTKLFSILDDVGSGTRLRLIGIDLTFSTNDQFVAFKNYLDKCRGLDETGMNVSIAQVSGVIHLDTVSLSSLDDFAVKYPYITIDAANKIYFDADEHLIYESRNQLINVPEFELSLEDGHIYMNGDNDVFVSGENVDGHLMVEMN